MWPLAKAEVGLQRSMGKGMRGYETHVLVTTANFRKLCCPCSSSLSTKKSDGKRPWLFGLLSSLRPVSWNNELSFDLHRMPWNVPLYFDYNSRISRLIFCTLGTGGNRNDWWRHNYVTLQCSLYWVTSCSIITQWPEYGNILSSKDKISIETCGNLKDFFLKRLIKEYFSKNWQDKHWETFCERCALCTTSSIERAVWSRRPQSSELQISLLQLKTQLSWSCKFYTCFVERSFLFPVVHKV